MLSSCHVFKIGISCFECGFSERFPHRTLHWVASFSFFEKCSQLHNHSGKKTAVFSNCSLSFKSRPVKNTTYVADGSCARKKTEPQLLSVTVFAHFFSLCWGIKFENPQCSFEVIEKKNVKIHDNHYNHRLSIGFLWVIFLFESYFPQLYYEIVLNGFPVCLSKSTISLLSISQPCQGLRDCQH